MEMGTAAVWGTTSGESRTPEPVPSLGRAG